MQNKTDISNQLDLNDYDNKIDIRKKIFFDEINVKNNQPFLLKEISQSRDLGNDIKKRRHSLFKLNAKKENNVCNKRNSFLVPNLLDTKSRNLTKLLPIYTNDNNDDNLNLPLINNQDNRLTDNNRNMNSYYKKTMSLKFKSFNNLQNIILPQEKENEFEDKKLNTTSKNILHKLSSKSNKLLLKVKSVTNGKTIIKDIKDLDPELIISDKDISYPKYPKVKHSKHSINKYIKSFAVNSYQGLFKNYNEDKVSMILTIKRPKTYPSEKYWPNISYLALFDGHGGSSCGNFLRDNLHNYIIKENNFLENIEQSLINSFEKAENDFLKIAKENNDKSGSCALVCLIIDNYLYIANCGDSRAIISLNSGKEIKILNTIHRPYNKNEKNRILENGGRIYYSNNIMRIYPGRLSVSRAFGDKNAKFNELGEKKNVLISIPEICKINLKGNKIDFLIMGCDGIFDSLSNKDCVDCAWKIMNENKKKYNNFHELNGDVVDFIIKSALKRNTMDNVTALFVSFKNFHKQFYKENLNHYFNFNDIYQSDEGSENKNGIEKKKIIKFKSLNDHIKEDLKHEMKLSSNNLLDGKNNDKIMNNSTVRPIIRVK